MDAQLPCVPKGPDLLRLAGQVLILAILHVPLIHEGLEVAAILHSIGWIDVDHLHLAGHALLLQKGIHDQEGIPGNETIGPAMRMLVELYCCPHRRILVRKLEERGLDLAAALPDCLDDGLGIYALMDMQGDCRDLERGVLSLACPDELGIEMRIILVGLGFAVYISGGSDQADGRVV